MVFCVFCVHSVTGRIQGSRDLDQLGTCSSLHVAFSASDSYKVFFPEGLFFKLCYKADAHFPYPRVICTGLQL